MNLGGNISVIRCSPIDLFGRINVLNFDMLNSPPEWKTIAAFIHL